MFVKLDCRKPPNDKHSSLLRKSIIYGQKKFYNIQPLVSPANIRLDWKGLPGANALAYTKSQLMAQKFLQHWPQNVLDTYARR